MINKFSPQAIAKLVIESQQSNRAKFHQTQLLSCYIQQVQQLIGSTSASAVGSPSESPIDQKILKTQPF